MRILLDHGAYGNLGDAAMVEGVALRLHSLLPQANIHIIDLPNFNSSVWDFNGFHRQASYTVRPVGADIGRFPVLWRWSAWHRLCSELTISCLGRGLPAGSLHLYPTGMDGMGTLGRFCEQFDALHIAGGGNLTDIFPQEVFRRCCLIQAFAEQRKPIVLTGQQFGPFRSILLRSAVATALRKVDSIGVREPASLMFCQMVLRGAAASCDLMGDDSFGLAPAKESCVTEALKACGIRENEFLAVNVRMKSYAIRDPGHLETIAEVLCQLSKFFGMPILAVPIDFTDIASIQKIAAVSCSERFVFMTPGATPSLVKGVLAKAFGAIGVSYHFCTFALSQGVPAVCLYDGDYYCQKARGLADFWKDQRLALPLHGLGSRDALRHIIRVLKDQKLRRHLAAVAETASRNWYELFDRRVRESFGN